MPSRKTRARLRILWRFVVNLWRALISGKDHVLPIVSVFYLARLCNANCDFCSQSTKLKRNRDEPLSLDEIRIVLLRLFAVSPAIYITGGEPLLHRQLVPVLEMARKIGFWPIAVNTNGLRLQQVPDVLRLADRTIVSLHSYSARKNARIMQVNLRLMTRAILYLIKARTEAMKHGNRLQINSVLTAENVSSASRLLRLCEALRLPLTVVPAIANHQPTLATASQRTIRFYQRFIQLLLDTKHRRPWLVANTRGYLKRIKSFESFQCRPSFTLAVNPDGTVKNPCEIKYPSTPETLGSLLEEDALPLLQRQLDFNQRFVRCEHNCCKTCYVEPALAFESPLSALREFVR